MHVIIAILVLLRGVCAQPRAARCPPRWYLSEGVRRSGEYVCHEPLPRSLDDTRDGASQGSDGLRIPGRIYCTGGARSIVVDERTVGCQRGDVAR